MQKRTKKITAVKNTADDPVGSTEILQTRSQARSDTENFGRFASVFVRDAFFFKAATAVLSVVGVETTQFVQNTQF